MVLTYITCTLFWSSVFENKTSYIKPQYHAIYTNKLSSWCIQRWIRIIVLITKLTEIRPIHMTEILLKMSLAFLTHV